MIVSHMNIQHQAINPNHMISISFNSALRILSVSASVVYVVYVIPLVIPPIQRCKPQYHTWWIFTCHFYMAIQIVSRITSIQSFSMIFVSRELPDFHLSFPPKIVEFTSVQPIVHPNLVNSITCLFESIDWQYFVCISYITMMRLVVETKNSCRSSWSLKVPDTKQIT